MEFLNLDARALDVLVQASRFRGEGGVEEFHLILRPTLHGGFSEQIERLRQAWLGALSALDLDASSAVWRRFFLSDPANQAPALAAAPLDGVCADSVIGQPPAPPAKLALWAYHVRDPRGPLDKSQSGPTLFALRRDGGLTHLWATGLASPGPLGAHGQTLAILETLRGELAARALTLADNLLRTWIFARNVDDDYQDIVVARRDFFAAHGLTPQTHCVASTGIQGAPPAPKALVAMDAYGIEGVRPAQVRHLEALDHLPPASAYGVTFERATRVAYRDRQQVLVSGTASIDRDGHILHAGDLGSQTARTLDNVEALLAQAGMRLADLAVCLAYARDPSDVEVLSGLTRARLGGVPCLVVTAPICRPGWLVEIEGIALGPASNPALPEF